MSSSLPLRVGIAGGPRGKSFLAGLQATGVAHLATAFGKPSVVLFGPTPPALWGPPPGHRHTVLWKGRRSDPLADRPAPGLLALQPPEVVTALAALG